MRRRQRRLRAQLRHEQQSAAMAVAAAFHHSANKKSLLEKEVVEGTHNARQGQKTAAGTRPAPLAEVAEPQGVSVAPRCPDAGVPLLSVPLLAGGDGLDKTTVRWLLKVELRKRQYEEEVEERGRGRRRLRRQRGGRRLSWITQPLSKRKRKKRRKKRRKRRKRRAPRTSSHSSSRRARRRPRQWHTRYAGFPGDPLRAVFSSSVGMPVFPGILAGMDQKDSGALIVDSCSDKCKARIAGFTPRYVFPLAVGRPAARSASWPVWTRGTFMQLAGFTGDDTSCAVFSLIAGRTVLPGIMDFLDRVVRCALRKPHGPDSADLRDRAVLGQGGHKRASPTSSQQAVRPASQQPNPSWTRRPSDRISR